MQSGQTDPSYKQALRDAENMPEPGGIIPPATGKKPKPPFPWMTLLLFIASGALFCLVGLVAGWTAADRGWQIMPWVAEAVDYLGGFFADDLENGRWLRLATGTLFYPSWLGFILSAVFIFYSMARNIERVCGPVALLCAYVLGGAAGNALVAATMHGEHIFLSPIGGVIFGIEGLLLGCAIRYRAHFQKSMVFDTLKGLAFWIVIICLLLFVAFNAPWQYILDIPGGLFAGIACGLLFPVRRFEDEPPIGGTIIKYLVFAGVTVVLAAGFISVARADAPVIDRPAPAWRSFESEDVDFTFPVPPGATVETGETGETQNMILKIEDRNFLMGLFVKQTNMTPGDAVALAREHFEKRFSELRVKGDAVSGLQFAGSGEQAVGTEKGFMFSLVYEDLAGTTPDGTKRVRVPMREYYYVVICGGRMYRFIFTYPDCAPGETDFSSDIREQIIRQFRFPAD